MYKKLTIVIPFLDEEENLANISKRLREIGSSLEGIDIEFVFVDDGSQDDSVEIVKRLQKKNKNVKLIVLSKNFGPHSAILSAINSVQYTDYLTVMSADLQEPATLYIDLFNKIVEAKSDVVLADRENRNTDNINKFFSGIYNKLVNKYAIEGFPKKGLDVFMISSKVISKLKNKQYKNTSLHGVIFDMGFDKEYVPYTQLVREKGETKWSFSNKIKLFIDTFVSFSVAPLRLITISGILFSTIGFVYGVYIIVSSIMGDIKVEGWATLVAINIFGFGLVFLMLGIISEYIWRIYDQLNPKDMYIIKDKFGFDENIS